MRRLLTLLTLLAPLSANAQSGVASYYGGKDGLCGHRMANGRPFNCGAITCAHKTARLGSRLRVSTGKRSIVCLVTDRGPYVRGRIIDLSPAARRALGMGSTAHVTVEAVR